MVYHLESSLLGHALVVKCNLDHTQPIVDSISQVYHTAEFMEREVFDLFGVVFTGHPDLRRLFLEEEAGFPLRKDFVDEVNIIEK